MRGSFSQQCSQVVELLQKRKNVILTGPPASGKSMLLNEIEKAFLNPPTLVGASTGKGRPKLIPAEDVGIPKGTSASLDKNWIGGTRRNRKVFRTVFHQEYKNREFVTGLSPKIGGGYGFEVIEGILYRASEFAKQQDGAALLIIDELNRGPAVQIFGGSIAAIEPEKRLDANNNKTDKTQAFELLDPKSGKFIEYSLPENLFILAAMNQADSSIEPLDVAFLRRWSTYEVAPNYKLLEGYLNINFKDPVTNKVTSPKEVYLVAVKALIAINERIVILRGKDYRLGHGIFMISPNTPFKDITDALKDIIEIWAYIKEHIFELFFGDVESLAYILNASNTKSNGFFLQEVDVNDEIHTLLVEPDITTANICTILANVIGEKV
ncbi:AAA family ATPase [Bhargavaea massiliensis]|uniref:AAA family ATPase n=1 Tax=Bhargavaea massiliensis TaxID=2697500 RepID=UPI001BCB1ED5|nr:AAA family ATPase [Bhargavaea massiliensis]